MSAATAIFARWWVEAPIPPEWIENARQIAATRGRLEATRLLRGRLASPDIEYTGLEYKPRFLPGRANTPSLASCVGLLAREVTP